MMLLAVFLVTVATASHKAAAGGNGPRKNVVTVHPEVETQEEPLPFPKNYRKHERWVMPDGWEQYYDPATNAIYYAHTDGPTCTVSATDKTPLTDSTVPAKKAAWTDVTATHIEANCAGHFTSRKHIVFENYRPHERWAMPDGWEQYYDPATNALYYAHTDGPTCTVSATDKTPLTDSTVPAKKAAWTDVTATHIEANCAGHFTSREQFERPKAASLPACCPDIEACCPDIEACCPDIEAWAGPEGERCSLRTGCGKLAMVLDVCAVVLSIVFLASEMPKGASGNKAAVVFLILFVAVNFTFCGGKLCKLW